MTEKLKYLGITVNDSQINFRIQKEQMTGKARIFANMTYSVVARSCSKTPFDFFLSIAMPVILYSANINRFHKAGDRTIAGDREWCR